MPSGWMASRTAALPRRSSAGQTSAKSSSTARAPAPAKYSRPPSVPLRNPPVRPTIAITPNGRGTISLTIPNGPAQHQPDRLRRLRQPPLRPVLEHRQQRRRPRPAQRPDAAADHRQRQLQRRDPQRHLRTAVGTAQPQPRQCTRARCPAWPAHLHRCRPPLALVRRGQRRRSHLQHRQRKLHCREQRPRVPEPIVRAQWVAPTVHRRSPMSIW